MVKSQVQGTPGQSWFLVKVLILLITIIVLNSGFWITFKSQVKGIPGQSWFQGDFLIILFLGLWLKAKIG